MNYMNREGGMLTCFLMQRMWIQIINIQAKTYSRKMPIEKHIFSHNMSYIHFHNIYIEDHTSSGKQTITDNQPNRC